ncbi:hypothetical protein PENTCL1PPCAC_22149, partial [Pristionchus entomophagus]
EGAESGVEEEAEEEEEEVIGGLETKVTISNLGGVAMSPLDDVEAPDEKWPEVSEEREWSCIRQAGGCCCCPCCRIIPGGEPAAKPCQRSKI